MNQYQMYQRVSTMEMVYGIPGDVQSDVKGGQLLSI